jgi:hypothetical protein
VNNNPSYFDEFIDLFSRKGNKQHNLWIDYINSKDNLTQVITTKCSDVNLDSNNNLCLHNERPQVLCTILKHNLDVAFQNIVFLNDKILQSEISQTKKDNIIQDVLSLCKKAIDGSPFIGGNSPFLGGDSPIIEQGTSSKWSSPAIN